VQSWSVFDFSDSCFVYKISGDNISHKFSLEAGVHRLQRVPPTESNGRRHTSTIGVAILPFVEFDPKYKESDFIIECKLGSGPGGQHRNRTMSAIKVTHKSTGMNVTIDRRCQHTNKQEAMAILVSRLRDRDENLYNNNVNKNRVNQINDMGRSSGRVRTYNFIDDRVKDERIQKKFRTEDIMSGKLDLIYNEKNNQDQIVKCEKCSSFEPYEGDKKEQNNCLKWLCDQNCSI